MRVEKSDVFTPLVITLLTKEEADALWLLLNHSPYVADQADVKKDHPAEAESLKNIGEGMWRQFDAIYRP